MSGVECSLLDRLIAFVSSVLLSFNTVLLYLLRYAELQYSYPKVSVIFFNQISLTFFLDPLTIDSDMMPQKLIRQCLRQFDLLKNVWQTILPDDVYTSSLASLLNEFCIEIIRRVCTIEDIPSSVANGLVDILDVIIDRAPTIFQVSSIDTHEIANIIMFNQCSRRINKSWWRCLNGLSLLN